MNGQTKDGLPAPQWGREGIDADWSWNMGPDMVVGAYNPQFVWVKEYALRKAFNDNVLRILKEEGVKPPPE